VFVPDEEPEKLLADKVPPTLKVLVPLIAKLPVSVPPAKGRYAPTISLCGIQVGAALPFDFNICPLVP
jgi:hypothetical protein